MPQTKPSTPPPFDQGIFLLHYNRGREAFQEGRYGEARNELEKAQKMAQVGERLQDAYRIAKSCVTRDDLICITGSIFVVAQARRAWAARHPEAFAADDWVFQDETAGEIVPD